MSERIYKDWKSYDGFISFIDNDINTWEKHIFEETNETYIGLILAYFLYFKEKNISEYLIEWTLNDIDDDDYISYSYELKEKIDFAIKKREADKLQLNLEFKDNAICF